MDGQQTRSTAAGELATNDGQNDGKIAAQQYVKGTRGYTADTQNATVNSGGSTDAAMPRQCDRHHSYGRLLFISCDWSIPG